MKALPLYVTVVLCLSFPTCLKASGVQTCNFDDYPSEIITSGFAKNIDLSTHDGARTYRTVLTNGFDKEPNAAGHYVVIAHGCGTACQMNWITDKLTGKIVGVINTSAGLDHKVESDMLIINADEGFGYQQGCQLLKNGALTELKAASKEE